LKIFIDENLSPGLVDVGHDRGYVTTCARNLLGAPDYRILDFSIEEDRITVTNNADDFRELVGDVEIHPGLIVIPSLDRPNHLRLFDAALSFIEEQAAASDQTPRDLMVNRVVEIDDVGVCQLYDLP
jgi:predicted nuclease of predicted toxin-antitoxin system